MDLTFFAGQSVVSFKIYKSIDLFFVHEEMKEIHKMLTLDLSSLVLPFLDPEDRNKLDVLKQSVSIGMEGEGGDEGTKGEEG